MTSEYKKQYNKEYNKKNREKLKEYHKIYRENNKEKNNEKDKEYAKEYYKNYKKTDAGKKISKIASWKHFGVINDDFSSLYEHYINCKNCEECNVELQTGNGVKNKKCLDHDHTTGLFRNILCNSCNLRRGK